MTEENIPDYPPPDVDFTEEEEKEKSILPPSMEAKWAGLTEDQKKQLVAGLTQGLMKAQNQRPSRRPDRVFAGFLGKDGRQYVIDCDKIAYFETPGPSPIELPNKPKSDMEDVTMVLSDGKVIPLQVKGGLNQVLGIIDKAYGG